ncbi:hypothetical protein PNIG_a1536 [Pseudoalteromonas nigrifaciens]|uniref:Uncharacterized protein n=1 Tax=Pseudoalteromonas nigrifaciens TaxID=28109 RepID=A0AAC9UFU0_9GAMM|nr:hypothetical protein PNIG_a1536 [Pseudoalteromonas nigrifaciens]
MGQSIGRIKHVLRRNEAALLTQGGFFVRCTNSQGQRYA